MRLFAAALLVSAATVLSAQSGTPVPAAVPAQGAAPATTEGYSGPAILSRGGTSSLRQPLTDISFRPYATVNGFYDNGLATAVLQENGEISNAGSMGVEAGFGAYGYRKLKRDLVSLDYRGTYRYYTHDKMFNGTDQFLTLGYAHHFSRRTSLTLREAAGTFSRAYGFYNQFGVSDPSFASIPTFDMLDDRTYYLSSMADVTWQKSARLSFNAGGDGFITRRKSNSLIGYSGIRVRGDVAYRYSRNSTIGVAYSFNHYEYTSSFGAIDLHGLNLNHSTRLTRQWELNLLLGGYRMESLALAQVAIDPVVAAIIGQSTGVEARYRVNYLPNFVVSLNRAFQRASLGFSYTRGFNPGNGIYVGARTEAAGVSYGYTGIRKWNIGASGGYGTYSGVLQGDAGMKSFLGGVGITYQVQRFIHLNVRGDYRNWNISTTGYKRVPYRVSLGIAFSPGDMPLSIW